MFRRRGKIAAVWLSAVVCAFFLPVAAMAATGAVTEFASQFFAQITGTLAPQDPAGRTTVLLLGVGDREHSAADLTDAIVIASIDPETRSASLLSIPRDTYLMGDDRVHPGRINSVYALAKRRHTKEGMTATGASVAAMRDLADELEDKTGVSIQGVLKLDFTGFERMIDAFGGVDVTVHKTIVDETFPLAEGVVGRFEIAAGEHHLDGVTALRYARSRHSTSDFDRSARQQQILRALMDQARKNDAFTTISALDPLRKSLEEHAEWTFTETELLGLAGAALRLQPERVITMSLNTRAGSDMSDAAPGGFIYSPPPGVAGTGSTLLPISLKNDPDDWDQIAAVATLLTTARDAHVDKPAITITHVRGGALQAHRLRNELTRYGLMVAATEQTDEETPSTLEILGGTSGTARVLSSLTGIPFTWRSNDDASTVKIVLGRDYRFVPFATKIEHTKTSPAFDGDVL